MSKSGESFGITISRINVDENPQIKDATKAFLGQYQILGNNVFDIEETEPNLGDLSRIQPIANNLSRVVLGITVTDPRLMNIHSGITNGDKFDENGNKIATNMLFALATQMPQRYAPGTDLAVLNEVNNSLEALGSPLRLPLDPENPSESF